MRCLVTAWCESPLNSLQVDRGEARPVVSSYSQTPSSDSDTMPPELSTLARGLQVLESLAKRPASVNEVADECGLARQTAYRLVSTLVSAGWVDRVGSQYRASPRVWALTSASFSFSDLQLDMSQPLRDLAREYGESVHLAIYDRGDSVYIDKADGSRPVGSYTTLGGRAPAWCVATGKVLLANRSPAEREKLMEQGLERFTDATITDPHALERELAEVAANGHAVNRGEWRAEVGGLAVPLHSPSGAVVAALGFSGPVGRILESRDSLLAALVETGARWPDSHRARSNGQ